jgi:N-acetylglucosaminyl-diphospho-decaprenol L-rhamnosyltransferase
MPLDQSGRALVVIVNYRTANLTVACLRSLQPEIADHPGCAVTVVDNASADGSVEAIRAAIDAEGWGGWVRVIASAANGGFAAGNNVAIRAALAQAQRPDYVWLVNPDTLVRRGALATLLAFMAGHPRAGTAGGSLDDEDGLRWPFAFRFPSLWSEIDDGLRFGMVSRWLAPHRIVRRMGNEPTPVDWISGANFMIRSALIDAIGLMDEGYFLYFEETDYCLQARRAGWECWYVPDARVLHLAGRSTGVFTKAQVQRRRPAYWFESRRRYFIKNHGRWYAMASDLLWLPGFALWRLRRWVQRKPDRDPPDLLLDFVRHSSLANFNLPAHEGSAALHDGPAKRNGA